MEVVQIENGRLPVADAHEQKKQGVELLYFLLYGLKSTATKQGQTHSD
jgi:hypothetical protein